MSKCDWGADCPREAKWQIELRLWALSMSILLRNSTNCVKMLSSVAVCDECKPKVSAQDFLLPEAKERIASALSQAGRADPDFNTAGLYFHEVIDEPIDPKSLVPPGAPIIEG